MAYKKEYPVLNDSGAGSLEEYTKRQEDRIEEGFESVNNSVRLKEGVDLDSINNPGIYSSVNTAVAETIKNAPTNIAFVMHVYERNAGNFVQKLTTYNGDEEFVRGSDAGRWQEWRKISRLAQGGSVFLTPDQPSGSNWYKKTHYVKFDKPFSKEPRVSLLARTGDPHLVFASAQGINREGFTITYVRPNQNGGQIDWLALEVDGDY